MSTVIDGRELAGQMQVEIQKDVEKMTQQGIQPGLAVLLVGENPAGRMYMRSKERAAAKAGILSKVEKLPEAISEEELLVETDKYNQDSCFHDISVRLPLPKYIDGGETLLAIDPKKDVDGFRPVNLDRLFVSKPGTNPCVPYGAMKMFEAYNIDLTGERAMVTGRSNIVGRPMAQLLLMKNATVMIVHSKTEHLAKVTKEADTLVVITGCGYFVTKEFMKPDAVMIDMGTSRNQEGKLIGDVASDEVPETASYITPVLKGAGSITITMLMY